MFLLETQEGKGGKEPGSSTVWVAWNCRSYRSPFWGLLSCFLSGGYEPPLTNVFTMQWFLTLFATCLPNHTVLKIWDSVFFEGSEVILRVSLAIWAKLGE